MKKCFLPIFALLFSFFINKGISQSTKPSFSAAIELKLPIGNSKKYLNAGGGLDIEISFPFLKKYPADISLGFFTLRGIIINGYRVESVYAIPVKVGFRYLVAKNYYIKPEAGYT